MIITGIIMLIFGAVIVFMMIGMDPEDCPRYFLTFVGFVAVCVGVLFIVYPLIREEAYINSLKGKNPYKMEIRYGLKDSLYIPKDTVYINTEDNE